MTRQRRFVIVAAVAAVVGLVTVFLIWQSRTGADAGGVRVTWASGSPSCRGAEVLGATSSRPVITGERGMRCVVTVRVTNAGDRAVHLDKAVAPSMGPGGTGVVRAVNVEHAPGGSAHGRDAVIAVAGDLAAGRSTTFDVVLTLRLNVCDEQVVYLSDWPAVTIVADGRSFERHPDRTLGVRGGGVPGCRE